jgi:hypothetical protein
MGGHSGATLAECEKREQIIVMPEAQDQALKQPYHKDKFIYDTDTDSYQCPCGQTLSFIKTKLVRKTLMRLIEVMDRYAGIAPHLVLVPGISITGGSYR